ncbi:hydroxymyristoyl-ACP dehydratase [Pricia sp. S334]|uniref:Hydroxymyristoyl-ACP dehydratase n=1 Tax=Pricia mediterranea TaxID=3076079 RepID=A0ABU3LA70_9FLAO|nr:hydroxymyristoyl-ACP dehydratase [Pricia sp. S334]MDT7830565.1 hydroxymyristoyl-ACP dehydratase [Pricia sp. S334]
MSPAQILQNLPYSEPFLFVDELLEVDESGCRGTFTFVRDLDFFGGHFKGNPVTPGAILTECCAQIGVVCLGIYLLGEEGAAEDVHIGMSSADMEFLLPVLPDEKVTVTSKKIYFRFQKLKSDVKMYNAQGRLICKGKIAGMIKTRKHG